MRKARLTGQGEKHEVRKVNMLNANLMSIDKIIDDVEEGTRYEKAGKINQHDGEAAAKRVGEAPQDVRAGK